jgi:hypothetical protein
LVAAGRAAGFFAVIRRVAPCLFGFLWPATLVLALARRTTAACEACELRRLELTELLEVLFFER